MAMIEAARLGLPSSGQENAADLLRPMLRQWLQENMPRLVLEALSRENPDRT
jgi:cell pole-organizing protein PopZ